jgi:hypothetical protein
MVVLSFLPMMLQRGGFEGVLGIKSLLKNVLHREDRQVREEILKNINIHAANLQENLRDLKLSCAAFASQPPRYSGDRGEIHFLQSSIEVFNPIRFEKDGIEFLGGFLRG